jgi:hypothetical protein
MDSGARSASTRVSNDYRTAIKLARNGLGEVAIALYQMQLSAGVAGEYSPATVADINGDGIPDITILTPGSRYVYLGMGNATYATPFYLGTRPSPSSLLAADLHGQKRTAGLADFVVADETGGVLVLINTTK